MPIRQGSENAIEVTYTLPNFAFDEQKHDYNRDCAEDVKKAKHRNWVRRLCSVATATHKFSEFTPITAQDVGGRGNLAKLVSAGAVAEASEEIVGFNRGDYEGVVTGKGMPSLMLPPYNVPPDRRIRVQGEGVNPEEFAIPPREGYQAVRDNRVVTVEGHPGDDGRARFEELIEKGYIRRVKLRDAAKAAVKKRLAQAKKEASK
jgi:hypothetical protein